MWSSLKFSPSEKQYYYWTRSACDVARLSLAFCLSHMHPAHISESHRETLLDSSAEIEYNNDALVKERQNSRAGRPACRCRSERDTREKEGMLTTDKDGRPRVAWSRLTLPVGRQVSGFNSDERIIPLPCLHTFVLLALCRSFLLALSRSPYLINRAPISHRDNVTAPSRGSSF